MTNVNDSSPFNSKMVESTKLYDSNYCRLCGEQNENGTQIFQSKENALDLSQLINKYLPITVEDDKKFPTSICPGCHIQLEATKSFMDLIVKGQAKLRNLYSLQQKALKQHKAQVKQLLQGVLILNDDGTIEPYEDADGKQLLVQALSDNKLYVAGHELSLKAEGLERPKRKRGRPPKIVAPLVEDEKEVNNCTDEKKDEPNDEEGVRQRRKIKAPTRFVGVLEGDELEKLLKEEGVIDKDDLSETAATEVIGKLVNENGESVGEDVVMTPKQKARLTFGTITDKKKAKDKYQCDICSNSYASYGRYQYHRKTHRILYYVCKAEGCEFKSKNPEGLEQHRNETRHEDLQLVVNVFNGLLHDVPDKNSEIEPTKITEEQTETATKQEPDPLNVPKNTCLTCGKTFSCKQNLEVHERSIHKLVRSYKCSHCDKSFAYANSLKSHMVTHAADTGESLTQYTCNVCNKGFTHQSSLLYHKETAHNNGKKFVCVKCGKRFNHKQRLVRHQIVHSDTRPFVCQECNSTFKTRANLKNHQAIHRGEKRFVCEICGQKFSYKTSLVVHERWHEGKKPYKCDVCNKDFTQKGNLLEHKRTHTGEKPFCCDMCGRKFTTSSQFSFHRMRHTGVRPWGCSYCPRNFLTKSSLETHVRRHFDDKPIRCPVCPMSFVDKNAMIRHRKVQHSKEHPHVCPRCGKKFKDRSNYLKHTRIHERREKLAEESALSETEQKTNTNSIEDVSESRVVPPTPTNTDHSNDSILRLTQVVDEQGMPISIKTQDGLSIPIVTGNDENRVHGLLPDGTLVPIELNDLEDKNIEEIVINNTNEPVLEGPISILTEDIDTQPLNTNIQLMTNEHGQEMCLLTYSVDNATDSEINQPLTLESLLSSNNKVIGINKI